MVTEIIEMIKLAQRAIMNQTVRRVSDLPNRVLLLVCDLVSAHEL